MCDADCWDAERPTIGAGIYGLLCFTWGGSFVLFGKEFFGNSLLICQVRDVDGVGCTFQVCCASEIVRHAPADGGMHQY